jgi:hypothetical protein
VDRTCSGIEGTDLTSVQYRPYRLDNFSTLLEFGFLSSLLESLWVLSTLVLSRSPCSISLYSTTTYTQEGNKTLKNKLEIVNLILLFNAPSSLSKLEGVYMILT